VSACVRLCASALVLLFSLALLCLSSIVTSLSLSLVSVQLSPCTCVSCSLPSLPDHIGMYAVERSARVPNRLVDFDGLFTKAAFASSDDACTCVTFPCSLCCPESAAFHTHTHTHTHTHSPAHMDTQKTNKRTKTLLSLR
jgi:hypothetical protein